LTEDEDGSTVIEKAPDFESDMNSLFPALGGSCPPLYMTNGIGQTLYVETDNWAPTVRAGMTLLLWVGVFLSSWFLFWKWAFVF